MNNIKNLKKLSNFNRKIFESIYKNEKNNIKPFILEFGVRKGNSTRIFLKMASTTGGKVLSVDVNDYSHLFKSTNWKFINCRDDNYQVISPYLLKKVDFIFVDSLHEPEHVKKIIYLYWKHLKINGSIYIDDISWLPYAKGSWRDHSFTESINRTTFYKLLEILYSNRKSLDMEFNFIDSGICRIIKKKINLKEPERIKTRNNRIKIILNFFKVRKIIDAFK
jgi:hypothetical protein